jgi:hypothetical protein
MKHKANMLKRMAFLPAGEEKLINRHISVVNPDCLNCD